MKSLKELSIKSNDLINTNASIFLIMLLILSSVMYFTIDPLNFRYANKFKIYNYTAQKNVRLIQIIKTNDKYKNTAYDYSKQLRYENLEIEGKITIKSINKSDTNKYYITSKEIYVIVYDKNTNKYGSYRMVLWLKDFENSSKYYEGRTINFRGKFYCIDNENIVIDEAIITN